MSLDHFTGIVKNRLQEIGCDTPSSPILLAISGGVDSVVMAHLFHFAGWRCAVAHCNFSLRGEESDGDEEFVKKLALHYGFEFHSKRFDTEAYATDNGISIQMAARQLRYRWFDELMKEHGYSCTAVAHHADDVAETMLINLTRGTGIAGMHGMASAKEKIIRPLLDFTREEIVDFAESHHLSWRNDSSNSEELYTRNRIRHSVIPVLKEINPAITEALTRHASLMSGYEKIIEAYIETISKQLIRAGQSPETVTIDLQRLDSLPATEIILYHLLAPYGFNASECRQILQSRRTGAEFFAPGYKLVIGRDAFFIMPESNRITRNEFTIHESDAHNDLPAGTLTMERINNNLLKSSTLPDDFTKKEVAYLDSSNLTFPLAIRPWKAGDAFHPLGMKGSKLLSDFFTDEKFTPDQKESVLLLLSGPDVVWVIGHRPDHRFRITEKTESIRKFTWSKRQ
jgi:tRNA(Ile)-lysidine synthase